MGSQGERILMGVIQSGQATTPEEIIAALGILLIIGFAAVAAFRWIVCGPKSPDPWEKENLSPPDQESTILCHRCLVPNQCDADFCEQCGAPIGQYTNYLPFPYLFSIGHLLRVGTSGEFKRTKMNILGFVILSLAEYSIFAPIYLYQFFKRGLRQPPGPPSQGSSSQVS